MLMNAAVGLQTSEQKKPVAGNGAKVTPRAIFRSISSRYQQMACRYRDPFDSFARNLRLLSLYEFFTALKAVNRIGRFPIDFFPNCADSAGRFSFFGESDKWRCKFEMIYLTGPTGGT